jgi:hypothetical protein
MAGEANRKEFCSRMEKISHRKRGTLMLVGYARRRGSRKEENPTARGIC